MVSIVKKQNRTFRLRRDDTSGVTITRVAEIPAGVSVTMWTFDAEGYTQLADATDVAAWCVLTGTGWIEGHGVDRRTIVEGDQLFVGPEDNITIGTTQGMVLLSVFGGWMLPE